VSGGIELLATIARADIATEEGAFDDLNDDEQLAIARAKTLLALLSEVDAGRSGVSGFDAEAYVKRAEAIGDPLATLYVGYREYVRYRHDANSVTCRDVAEYYIRTADVTMDEIEGTGDDVKLSPVFLEDMFTNTELEYALKEETDAVEYYRSLAETGDPDASLVLGDLLLYGDVPGVPPDPAEAQIHLQRAADAGIADARTQIGMMHLQGTIRGEDGEANYTAAVENLEMALDMGATSALTSLGFVYLEGLGVEKNETRAFEMFQRSADSENTDAYSNLGALYLDGVGTERNVTAAKRYFELGKESGHLPAMYNLGVAVLEGIIPVDETNETACEQAVALLKVVAESGDWFRHALHGIEKAHVAYLNDKARSTAAFLAYAVSATAGSDVAQINAAYILRGNSAAASRAALCGDRHHDDNDDEDDAWILQNVLPCASRAEMNRASKQFLDMAEAQGLADARVWLAKCHLEKWEGACEEGNVTRARSFIEAATSGDDAHHAEAFFLLGVMQQSGHGGPRNETAALESFRRCSETDSRCDVATALFRVKEWSRDVARSAGRWLGMWQGSTSDDEDRTVDRTDEAESEL